MRKIETYDVMRNADIFPFPIPVMVIVSMVNYTRINWNIRHLPGPRKISSVWLT